MGRTTKNDNYTKLEDIYKVTDNGIDIFKKYINLKRKAGRWVGQCPTGKHTDVHPSFNLSDAGNAVCFSCGWKGDATDLVMMREHVDLPTAVRMIERDFKISEKPVPVESKMIVEKEFLNFDFTDKPFTKQHSKYMDRYFLEQSFLRRKDTFAVDKWAINGKIQRMEPEQYSFAFYDEKHNITKILSLNVPVERKWRYNGNPDFVFYLPEEPVEDLFYAKSNKDALVLEMLGYRSSAAMSENSQVTIQVLPKIYEVCKDPVLHFGVNEIDAKKTQEILEVYPDLRTLTTPKNLLKFSIEDISDYIEFAGKQSTLKLINKSIK